MYILYYTTRTEENELYYKNSTQVQHIQISSKEKLTTHHKVMYLYDITQKVNS